MKKYLVICLLAVTVWATLGCVSPQGETIDQRRRFILKEHDEIMSQFVAENPSSDSAIRDLAGYVTMSNINTQVLLLGGGNGYGIAVRSDDGEVTFMKSTEYAGGPGVGVASYRSVLLFDELADFERFIAGKWVFQAEADATARSEDVGGSAQTTGNLGQPLEIYHLDSRGFQAKANLSSVRFEPDPQLNTGSSLHLR